MGLAGVRHLDQLEGLAAGLDIAPAGQAVGQERGIRTPQQLPAGVNLLYPQAKPQFNVGPHLVRNTLRSLRRQNKVNALGPANARNALQLQPVFGVVINHLRIFVDDDKQMGVQTAKLVALPDMETLTPVFDNVLGPGFGIQTLAAADFGIDRGEHAGHGRLVQVGDNIHAVGQPLERLKSAATLVIDQHKVQNVRGII